MREIWMSEEDVYHLRSSILVLCANASWPSFKCNQAEIMRVKRGTNFEVNQLFQSAQLCEAGGPKNEVSDFIISIQYGRSDLPGVLLA